MNCRCENCGKLLLKSIVKRELTDSEYCSKCGTEISSQKMKEIKKTRNLCDILIIMIIILTILGGYLIIFG